MSVIQELFPKSSDIDQLQRTPGDVDLLIGNDYLGLHLKKEMGHITLFSTKPMETAKIFGIRTLN